MLAVIVLGVGYALSAPAAPASTYRSSARLAGVGKGALRLDAAGGAVRLSGRDLGADLYQARVEHASNAQPTVEDSNGVVHVATPRVGAGVLLPNPAARDHGASIGGRVWTSPGFDSASGHYEIRAAGVGSHVRLETVP